MLPSFHTFLMLCDASSTDEKRERSDKTRRRSDLLMLDAATGLVDLPLFARATARTPSGGMVSMARREATVLLAARAILDEVPGDFVETGTNTGGTAVLMLKTLLALDTGSPRRHWWGFDSFLGLPDPVDGDRSAGKSEDGIGRAVLPTAVSSSAQGEAGMMRTSQSSLRVNLRKNNVDDWSMIHIGKGWFNTTLPRAHVKRISFLRLDGDLYVSTWEGLHYLYPKLSSGGYVYVDDYGSFEGCKRAVNLYRQRHNITSRMWPVFEKPAYVAGKMKKGAEETEEYKVEAVWWRKGG